VRLLLKDLLFSLVATGTDYYVKNTGNDSNTGLSDAQAWAHHPWMSTWTGSVVLKPGDNVYMNRGDIWSIENPNTPFMTIENSGSQGSPITTTAYGSGAVPIIKISTATDKSVVFTRGQSFLVFDNLHIQHHSGTFCNTSERNGIFFYNGSHDITITNCEIDNIPNTAILGTPNCYNIIIGDTTATQIATASAYNNNIHNFGYGGIELLGVNPENGESNFYVYHNYIHDATRAVAGENEYGISITANSDSHGWPKFATIRYNRIEDIKTWTAVSSHGGSYLYFIDNYIKNFGKTGVAINGTSGIGTLPATCDHLYVERNTIEQTPGGWITGAQYSFICQYPAITANATNIYIRDNILFYTSFPLTDACNGILAGNVDGLIISGNKIYNGSVTNGFSAIYLRNNSGTFGNKNVEITKNLISEWGPGITLEGGSITGSVAITYNIIAKPALCYCISICNSDISTTGVLTIYNNTFINDNDDGKCFVTSYGIAAGGSVIAENNIFGGIASNLKRYWYWGGTISGTFTCDNNLYWNSSSGSPFYQDGSIADWTAWNLNLGHDIHGIGPNFDPFFKNSSGSYLQDLDFDIQSNSPAINKGTDVGLSTDYAGNPISGIPDIGALEYQPVIIPSPIYTGSVVENSAPSLIELTYSLALATIVPSTSAFVVQVNSATRTLNSISISGTKVLLTLASPVAYGDVITVAYTKPSANPLQTSAGGQAASITAQSVTNKVAAPAVPVYSSAAIENSAPSKLEMTYSLSLANIVPGVSAFAVKVNSTARTVSSVAISGTKVLLTLASPVAFGDIVTVAYTKPTTNPLQTATGGQAASISAQTVTNRVAVINVAPVIVVTSPSSSFSGFVNEISASGSYDANKDKLSFTWTVPESVPISSSSGATIRFLGPMVDQRTNVEITVSVSDGKTSQKKTIRVEIVPYKPELEVAEVLSVEASSYNSLNYPHNIIDGNIGTIWSANGIDQWLILELKELFSVYHVKLAFQPGQKKESYFDILGSDDKEKWEPILSKSASCDFSGDLQVFDFPPSKTGKEFKYVKLAGLGNSIDTWNYVSELKVYGYRHPNPSLYVNQAVKLYPNPASNIINIRIDEPTLSPDFIRIIDPLGKIVSQNNLDPEIKEFQIPINLQNGIYIVQMGSDELTLFTQKLIVALK
jgi:uncharacterized repeat protein (TIGR02059 family)